MYDVPLELRLAAACSYLALDAWPQQREQVLALLRQNPDIPTFLKLVLRHRIQVLAHLVLSKLEDESGAHFPWLERLSVQARQVRIRSLALHAEWARLQAQFSEAGIKVEALKGTELSQRLYGDCGLRHTRDIDLLVEAEDSGRACDLLESSGYSVKRLFPAGPASRISQWLYRMLVWHVECDSNSAAVELHWRFERLCGSALNGRWRTLLQTGPRNHFDLLYCCLHGSAHGWNRLKWLGEIRILAARLDADDWPPILTLARDLRMETLLAQALLLLESLYDFPVPPEARGLIKEQETSARRLAKESIQWIQLREKDLRFTGTASKLRSRKLEWALGRRYRWHERLFHLVCVASFSPVDMAQWRLPVWLLPLYPLLRPVSLLRRVFESATSGWSSAR